MGLEFLSLIPTMVFYASRTEYVTHCQEAKKSVMLLI